MDKNEFEKVIKACRFCLMCRHLCTVGNITYAETNTPRGQALMLDCMGSEALEDTPENRRRAAAVLFACCYCGHCLNNCVSSYRHPDAIIAARADVSDEDLPDIVQQLRAQVKQSGGFFEKGKQMAGKSDIMDADVLLYIGSYARNAAPEIAKAAINILRKSGVSYTMISHENGTGMDAYMLGMTDLAQPLMDDETMKISALNPKRVVCLSPEDQRALSGDVPGIDASALEIPVISFTSLLLELMQSGKVKTHDTGKAVVAWHDGDQGGRFLQEFDAPREVIKTLKGIEYRELFWSGGEAASAGESGAIRFLDEDLAKNIAMKRMEQIEGRGIEILVTDSAEAKAQLASLGNEKIQIVHIAEFVSMSI